jgi:hypothetical protein
MAAIVEHQGLRRHLQISTKDLPHPAASSRKKMAIPRKPIAIPARALILAQQILQAI